MNWYKISQKAYEEIKDGEVYRSQWPHSQNIDDDIDVEKLNKWTPVDSSFIHSVSYYEPLKILDIKMINGKEYSFIGVPKKVFKQFMRAQSKGEFFNRVIKNRYRMSK